jgi:hypothetical protein
MSDQIHSCSELQRQIHEDLRIQHQERIGPNGDCPTCDSYESALPNCSDSVSTRTRVRCADRENTKLPHREDGDPIRLHAQTILSSHRSHHWGE